MRKKLFIFICDTYFSHDDRLGLRSLGLEYNEDFVDRGVGGVADIFSEPEECPWVSATHLLVFTGTFHGDANLAIDWAMKIKTINPSAEIYFRSMHVPSTDPVFTGNVSRQNVTKFHTIIQQFMEKARQSA